jgi:hypothetical protein
MPTFDTNLIPDEFNPLKTNTLDGMTSAKDGEGDEKLFVKFFTRPVLNPSKSTNSGRPIFDEVDCIEIRIPGSQLTSIVAPMKYYMQRFGARYRKWKENQQEVMSGTPLENFPFLFTKPGLTAELKALNVQTVEQLAALSDNFKQKIMGGFELCRQAEDWLTKTAADADDAEKRALKEQLATMQAQMATMLAAQTNAKEASVNTKPVPKEK